MITGNIKKYAPKARTRFIETMTRQAARYGISAGHKGEGHVAPAEVRGDVMLISALDDQPHSFPQALRGPHTVSEDERPLAVGIGVTGASLLHRVSLLCHGSPRSVYCLNGASTVSGQDQMADALIAATAMELGVPLLTANDRHYRHIDGLEIEVFRPMLPQP